MWKSLDCALREHLQRTLTAAESKQLAQLVRDTVLEVWNFILFLLLLLCVCKCVHVFVYMCMRACAHACVLGCVLVCARACVRAWVRGCVSACMCAHASACIQEIISQKQKHVISHVQCPTSVCTCPYHNIHQRKYQCFFLSHIFYSLQIVLGMLVALRKYG